MNFPRMDSFHFTFWNREFKKHRKMTNESIGKFYPGILPAVGPPCQGFKFLEILCWNHPRLILEIGETK